MQTWQTGMEVKVKGTRSTATRRVGSHGSLDYAGPDARTEVHVEWTDGSGHARDRWYDACDLTPVPKPCPQPVGAWAVKRVPCPHEREPDGEHRWPRCGDTSSSCPEGHHLDHDTNRCTIPAPVTARKPGRPRMDGQSATVQQTVAFSAPTGAFDEPAEPAPAEEPLPVGWEANTCLPRILRSWRRTDWRAVVSEWDTMAGRFRGLVDVGGDAAADSRRIVMERDSLAAAIAACEAWVGANAKPVAVMLPEGTMLGRAPGPVHPAPCPKCAEKDAEIVRIRKMGEEWSGTVMRAADVVNEAKSGNMDMPLVQRVLLLVEERDAARRERDNWRTACTAHEASIAHRDREISWLTTERNRAQDAYADALGKLRDTEARLSRREQCRKAWRDAAWVCAGLALVGWTWLAAIVAGVAQ